MADKDTEVKEAIASTQTEEKESKKEETPLKVFKVGDLNFKCHSCGHSYVIEEGVQGGIRFDLYTTNKHKLAMACPQCKAVMEMYFTEGDDSGVVDIDGNPIKSGSGTNPEEKTVKEDIEEVEAEEEGIETANPEKVSEGEESYDIIGDDEEAMEPDQEEELPEDDMEEEELPEDVKESILNENLERSKDEVSVQEEDKQTESV